MNFQIIYSNGFQQEKKLITRYMYDEWQSLENKERKEFEKEHNLNYYNYFVTGSPLYWAIFTGVIELPKAQGGSHKVKMKRIFI